MTEVTLPPWQSARLTVLLDALSGVPISDAERRSLVWLAGFEAHTGGERGRGGPPSPAGSGGSAVAWSHLLTDVPSQGSLPGASVRDR
jgi:hypothetical protein